MTLDLQALRSLAEIAKSTVPQSNAPWEDEVTALADAVLTLASRMEELEGALKKIVENGPAIETQSYHDPTDLYLAIGRNQQAHVARKALEETV